MYLFPSKKTDLVIDGGNVVKGADFVIMTEKVYHENPNYNPSEIHTELENLFQCKVIMIPWDKCEKYGHADGIVRPIDSENVLLTNYVDYDKDFATEVERRLSKHVHVEMLHYDVKSQTSVIGLISIFCKLEILSSYLQSTSKKMTKPSSRYKAIIHPVTSTNLIAKK